MTAANTMGLPDFVKLCTVPSTWYPCVFCLRLVPARWCDTYAVSGSKPIPFHVTRSSQSGEGRWR